MAEARWEEIVVQVTAAIRNGEFEPGDRLPSETDFSRQWGISRMTAHRVMTELREAGLVVRRPRIGTIVSDRRRLQTVAVMLHDTRLNPQASYLQGISEGLSSETDLVLHDTGGSQERESEILEKVRDRADGLIIFPTAAPENTAQLARLVGEMPLVCVDRVPDGLTVNAVLTDELESSLEGLRLLTDRGHRRIAHLTNDSLHVSSVRERLDAYLQTLADVGALQTQWLRTLPGPVDGFREFAERVHLTLQGMMQSEEPPTAVFCVHDDFMAAVLASLNRMGLKVPGDIEILSVNDTPTLPIFGLDQVHRIVPRTVELGAIAARRLIELATNLGSQPETLRLKSTIVPAGY